MSHEPLPQFLDSLEVESLLGVHDIRYQWEELSASGTHYLTHDSKFYHFIEEDGINADVPVYLPDATSVSAGTSYLLWNDSGERLDIFDGASGTLVNTGQGSRVWVSNRRNDTVSGTWEWFVASKSASQGVAPVLYNFGGNANTGRYMEIYPSESSLDAPLFFPEASVLTAITLQTSANNTATIGVFLSTDLVTPIYSIGLIASILESEINLNVEIPAGSSLSLRVTSGSMNKPRGSIYITGA